MGCIISRSSKINDPHDPLEEICNSYDSCSDANYNTLGHPTEVEANVAQQQKATPQSLKLIKTIEDEEDMKFKSFKQFDGVIGSSDHYYDKEKYIYKLQKAQVRRIENEWKVLQKNLPESIFVRAYEDRIDLLRAVIIGPSGTPYHDGLFFFDIYFPEFYPTYPPRVHYHSGGLEINPNLYSSGLVCLSLLDTWYGSACEKWSSNSTILQVLVSIQALVLNANPYFNEPGFSKLANFSYMKKKSLAYNENAFILSCRTMLKTLRRPPKQFEDFVVEYFRKQGGSILRACKAYMAGVKVGSNLDAVQEAGHPNGNNHLSEFEINLRNIFEILLKVFTEKGVDCSGFWANDFKTGGSNKAVRKVSRKL